MTADSLSYELSVNIYNDRTGDKLRIGYDADGLGLVEIKSDRDNVAILLDMREVPLVIRALNQLLASAPEKSE